MIIHDGTETMESYGQNPNDEPLRQVSETKKVLTWFTGRAKAGSGRQSAAEGPLDPELFHVAAPIMLGPDVIGGVRIGFSLKEFFADIATTQARLSKISDAGTEKLLLTAAVVTLVLVALGTLLADQLARRLSRPIETLAGVTAEIGKGRFDVDIPIQRSDEIGDLAVSVKRMARERKLAEEELRKVQDDFVRQERLAVLGKLAATVSHELRNPLGTIRTSIITINGLTKGRGLDVESAIGRIERNIKRCDNIIGEMLDFTRDTAQNREPTEVDDWLGGVLDEQ